MFSPAYLGSANPQPRGLTNKNRNTRIKNKMAQSSLKKSPRIPPLSAIKKHLLMLLHNHDKPFAYCYYKYIQKPANRLQNQCEKVILSTRPWMENCVILFKQDASL